MTKKTIATLLFIATSSFAQDVKLSIDLEYSFNEVRRAEKFITKAQMNELNKIWIKSSLPILLEFDLKEVEIDQSLKKMVKALFRTQDFPDGSEDIIEDMFSPHFDLKFKAYQKTNGKLDLVFKGDTRSSYKAGAFFKQFKTKKNNDFLLSLRIQKL